MYKCIFIKITDVTVLFSWQANSIMIAVVLWKMCTTAVMQNKSETEKLK